MLGTVLMPYLPKSLLNIVAKTSYHRIENPIAPALAPPADAWFHIGFNGHCQRTSRSHFAV